MESKKTTVKLTDGNYFSKKYRVVGLFNYIYGGAGILCTIIFTTLPLWVRIIAGAIYCFLVLSAVISTINRSSISLFLDEAEKFYFYGRKNGFQMDNIAEYLELVKRLHMESGIIDIQKDTANYSEIVNHLTEAKNSVKIIVYYGDRFLIQTKELLINAINRGVEVKLLMAEKESNLLKEVWDLEGDEKNNRWVEAKRAIDEIKVKTMDGLGTFDCRLYNTQARYALILIDSKWAWWTPYHPGIDVGKTSSFILIDNGEKSIIRQCKVHFTKLWNKLEKDEK